MQKALGNEAKNITNEYTSLAYFIKTKTRNVTEFERKICKILRLHHYIIMYFYTQNMFDTKVNLNFMLNFHEQRHSEIIFAKN